MPVDEPTLAPQDVRQGAILDALRRACATIAPAWPLENFVAVNPYLGLIDQPFDAVADRLAQAGGGRMTMPTAFYLEAVDRGRITPADLAAALKAADHPADTVDTFLAAVRESPDTAPMATVPTVADVAADCTGQDWGRLATDRVSAWAGAYFDRGQALWRSADATQPLFTAWKAEARVDRTPSAMGLAGFRDVVGGLPDEPQAAARAALERLGVPRAGLDLYLHRVLLRAGGWAGYAARVVWDARLYDGREDDTLLQFLAVLLGWEVALLETIRHPEFPAAWSAAKAKLIALGEAPERSASLQRQLILQDAFDRAAQRGLVQSVNAQASTPANGQRPDVQAVFCIDVRSEVFRRHLEAVAPSVHTIGFAGFFGFPVEYVPIAHETGGAQCPVLLTPSHTIRETVPDARQHRQAADQRRLAHHVKRAWNAFKMGAISCFSFVGPVGLAYLPKMFTDSFGWTRTVPAPDTNGLDDAAAGQKGPSLSPDQHADRQVGMPLDDRIEVAEGALRAMSMTDGFAPLVMITGHGATTVNNPYDTGLDCGACGGRTGEANARVAAAVLNDADVRAGLAKRGICIPDDTFFLACQHDTTTDSVTVFNRGEVPQSHRERLADLEEWLAEAGRRTRAERAERFHLPAVTSVDDAVIGRSQDWAEVRPEWGLAGCMAFIVAPRHRTKDLDLGGRSFLHSYTWQQDDDFSVLELIMTAPMVVTSWINLQYYASTVDNRLFGSGNKTLHNVVGKLGVLEGNGGDLRVGLPWQSVHDGEAYQHEPLRLNVVIEAPRDAMNDVLARHDDVRNLCDNGWLHLLAMDDAGCITHRYAGDLRWAPVQL